MLLAIWLKHQNSTFLLPDYSFITTHIQFKEMYGLLHSGQQPWQPTRSPNGSKANVVMFVGLQGAGK